MAPGYGWGASTGQFVVGEGDGSFADALKPEPFHEGPGFLGGFGLGDAGFDIRFDMGDELGDVAELCFDGFGGVDFAVPGDDGGVVVAEFED